MFTDISEKDLEQDEITCNIILPGMFKENKSDANKLSRWKTEALPLLTPSSSLSEYDTVRQDFVSTEDDTWTPSEFGGCDENNHEPPKWSNMHRGFECPGQRRTTEPDCCQSKKFHPVLIETESQDESYSYTSTNTEGRANFIDGRRSRFAKRTDEPFVKSSDTCITTEYETYESGPADSERTLPELVLNDAPDGKEPDIDGSWVFIELQSAGLRQIKVCPSVEERHENKEQTERKSIQIPSIDVEQTPNAPVTTVKS